jgi:transposase
MLAVIYRMLRRREEYVELGGNYYDQRRKPNLVARSVTRLIRLGHQVDLRSSIP